jgi:hypothetical protein
MLKQGQGSRPHVLLLLAGKHGAGMKQLDDILFKELQRGPGTVRDLALRLQERTRHSLERLHVRGHIMRDGRGGPHRQYVYRIPNRANRTKGKKATIPR